MTTMIAELYDALLSAGATDDKARRAAEAMANYDNRFDSLERRLDEVENKLSRRIDEVENSLNNRIDEVKNTLNRRMDAVETRLDRRIDGVVAELVLLRWMTVTGIGLSLAILVKLFVH